MRDIWYSDKLWDGLVKAMDQQFTACYDKQAPGYVR